MSAQSIEEVSIFSLEALRRSAASLLACTVLELFPDVLIGEGRITDIGFSCDFLFSQPIREDFLLMIDEKMRLLGSQALPLRSLQMMRENAAEFFRHKHQPIKAEIALSKAENIVELIQVGEFYDLCEEPHVETTHDLTAYKLQSLREVDVVFNAETLRMVRIEGTAFSDKQQLKQFLKRLEQVKKSDHCKIGQEMKLFTLHPTGLCFWLPKGIVLREILLDLWRKGGNIKQQMVKTPSLVPTALLDELNLAEEAVQEEAFIHFAGKEYALPVPVQVNHSLLFSAVPPKEQALPVCYAEIYENDELKRATSAQGLFDKFRSTADICQIFCTSDQVQDILSSSLQLMLKTITILDFEFEILLPGRAGRFAGSMKSWQHGIQLLKNSINEAGLQYRSEMNIDTAWPFGPRLEIKLIDSLGRGVMGPYLGLDCYHPAKMGLKYCQHEGVSQPPMMVCRSLFGSLERCIALLIEKWSGGVPLWLSPEQVRILPIAERHRDFAESLFQKMLGLGVRAAIDSRDEKMAAKIYDAQLERVPYAIVIGDQEQKNRDKVSVRSWNRQDTIQMSLEVFFEKLLKEIENRC